jgi:O-antigen/teichoic acid export membrane protein
MSNPEFKHLYKKQLVRRVKIIRVLAYISAIIAVISFIIFFVTDYKLNWSWLIIGFTYILMPINFVMQMRRIQKEIKFREERAKNRESDE